MEKFTLAACIGIALAPADGDSPELLLKSADDALYDAKHRPGRVIQLFDAGYREVARQRRKLERDLRYAFNRGVLSGVSADLQSPNQNDYGTRGFVTMEAPKARCTIAE